MDPITTTPAKDQKSLREQYGVSRTPIVAVEVHVRTMAFDHPEVNAQSWLLITPEGKRVVANSYDGKLGKNFDASIFTYDMPTDEKGKAKIVKKYERQVDLSKGECPFAILPTGTQPTQPAIQPVAEGNPETAPAAPEAPKEDADPDLSKDLESEAPAAPARRRK